MESTGNKSGYHEFTTNLSYVVMYDFNFSKIKIPDFGIFGDFNETEAVQLRVSNETEAFTEQNITLRLAF